MHLSQAKDGIKEGLKLLANCLPIPFPAPQLHRYNVLFSFSQLSLPQPPLLPAVSQLCSSCCLKSQGSHWEGRTKRRQSVSVERNVAERLWELSSLLCVRECRHLPKSWQLEQPINLLGRLVLLGAVLVGKA